ncbi:hypothetical protein ACFYPC_15945 [Streptomyces sp. NPDC005808]|uniref:hypothetical protein n=1 Tax=Streptomyces sp. NPDC005808 TaxID=3364734 RepID=UPI0036821000
MSRSIRGGSVALLLSVVLFPVALLLTGCGGSGGGTEAQQTEQSQQDDTQEAMLEYAQCMRQNGVQVPDPQAGDPGSLYDGVDTAAAAFKAADKDCAHLIAGIVQDREKQDPEQAQENQEELLALAKCLRAHGIDVSDPVPGQADGPFGKSLDRTDPAAATALKACQK